MQYEYPQVRRLYDSLLAYTDDDTAQAVAGCIPLSKTPTEKKRFAWAEAVCRELEERFDGDTVLAIRKACACGPGQGQMDELKRLYDDAAGAEDEEPAERLRRFAERATAAGHGYSIWTEGDALFLSYPVCYCSCVKHVDKPLPRAWCMCTLGYTERMFSHVLGRPVEAELLESVKTGGQKCVIRVVSKGE